MIAKCAAVSLLVCLLTISNSYACGKQAKKMTVSGILKYFPDNVQSREAWYGHNFMIEDMPIQPLVIQKEELLKYVGKRVKVSGHWFQGTEFRNDDASQKNSAMPIEATLKSSVNLTIMRNDGIDAEKIELLDK